MRAPRFVVLALLTASCAARAPRTPPVDPVLERLAHADALVNVGCCEADCEAGLYLGGVRVEKRAWKASAPVSAKSSDCYVQEEARLRAEIEKLSADAEDPERAARQLARRNHDLQEARRLQAAAAYQAGVAYWNFGARELAVTYARRAAQHEQFRELAEKILTK